MVRPTSECIGLIKSSLAVGTRHSPLWQRRQQRRLAAGVRGSKDANPNPFANPNPNPKLSFNPNPNTSLALIPTPTLSLDFNPAVNPDGNSGGWQLWFEAELGESIRAVECGVVGAAGFNDVVVCT